MILRRPSGIGAGENDDALCAVCGGGHSEAPNCIVFCDRCDVAVHQACYDLDTLPQGASLSRRVRCSCHLLARETLASLRG